MKIKTFPLKYVEQDLERIGKAADKVKESKDEFIKKAVEERIKTVEEES